MIQVSALDETVVHKKILIPPCLLRRVRLAYKTIDIQLIGILLDGY